MFTPQETHLTWFLSIVTRISDVTVVGVGWGGGGFGGPPPNIFRLNDVKSYNFTTKLTWKCTFIMLMKARDRVYDDLGEGTWNLEVIKIFQA